MKHLSNKTRDLSFEASGFGLPQRQELPTEEVFHDAKVHLRQLVFDLAKLVVPSKLDTYPNVCGGFKICRCNRVLRTKHENNRASSLLLTTRVQSLTMIPSPSFGCIISLISKSIFESQIYRITISLKPCSMNFNFTEMSVESLEKRPSQVPCKHIY